MNRSHPEKRPLVGNGRFEILERLGSGGMGVVFAAYDRERQVSVALKTLHRSDDPEALLRFKREFRSLADVSHTNLVRLYELIADDEQWFFTMELLEAVDFVSWVRRDNSPPPESADSGSFPTTAVTTPALLDRAEPSALAPRRGGEVDYQRLRDGLQGLVAGLSALHRSGHLHRDVKPSNVLVTSTNRVVVVDFGVIAAMSETSTEIIGTPAYMAPEQTAGEAETASDWYAVGAVIYEAITGRRPFHGSRSAILEAKRHWDPLRPQLALGDVPPELDALCMRLLDRNPVARPDGGEILETLSGQPQRRRRRRRQSLVDEGVVFFGRDRELAILDEALADIDRGRPSVVDLHGESGMGKTALVRHFLEQVERRGVAVLAGRCYQNETVPHKAIDSVVDALTDQLAELSDERQREIVGDGASDLARMFPVLRQIPAIAELSVDEERDQVEVRRRARLALRELLAGLARDRPVVVFIDDLHWGDVESAPLIDAITRPPDAPPIMLVATSRTRDRRRSPLLNALRRWRRRLGPALGIREIELGLLERRDAARLAARLLGTSGDSAADRVVDESRGNPYLIGELARFATRSDATGQAPQAPTLDAMIGVRLSQLGEAEALVLALLAVAGRPLSVATAREAAGIARPEWHALLHEMRHKQLLRISGLADQDSVEPFHDRIREGVAAALTDAERREHHRALAAALEATGAHKTGELAHHYAAAGDDERAVACAISAAVRASATLAFDQAAALWQMAIERGESRPEWIEARAEALVDAGRGFEAAECFILASRSREGLERIDLLRQAAEQYLRTGYIDRGLEVLGEVLAEFGVKLPGSARAAIPGLLWFLVRTRLRGLEHSERDAAGIDPRDLVRVDVCMSASIGLAQIDVGRAAAFAHRTLAYALEVGEPARLAYALALVAGFTAGSGADARADELLGRAAEIAERLDDVHLSAFVEIVGGVICYERGQFAEYLELAADVERVLRERCRGVAWELRTMQLLSGSALFYLGRLEELASQVPEWLSSATERGDLYASTNIHALAMPIVLMMSGDFDAVSDEHEAVEAVWTHEGFTLQRLFLAYTRTVADLYSGDTTAAYRQVASTDPDVKRSLLLHDRAVGNFWRFLRSSAALAHAAETTERPAALRRRAARDARHLARDRAPCYRAMGTALSAAIAHQKGTAGAARERLHRAIEQFDEAGFAIYAAAARAQLGGLTDDPQMVERAHARLGEYGADPERITRILIAGF